MDENGQTHDQNLLVLAGSFFPIHEGHIDLLRVAKDHMELNGHSVQCVVCVTSARSLKRKMGEITSDQIRLRNEVLNQMTHKYPWIRVVHCEQGVAACIKQLQGNVYQVCGVDNKIRFAKNNPRVIIVHDGRPVPEENRDVLDSNVVVLPFQGRGMSSTIARFLRGAPFEPEPFQFDWLRDTGHSLGQGAQGIVQLMCMGTVEVSVKFLDVRKRRDRQQFEVVRQIWEKLDTPTFRCYFAGYLNENVGVIVTDVGTSLSWVFDLEFTYQNHGDSSSKQFLEEFIWSFPANKVNYEDTESYRNSQEIKQSVDKEEVIGGLWDMLYRLQCHGILHRDIKCDNVLLVKRDGKLWVQLCDYGVAKFAGERSICPRGSLRYYPLAAIDDTKRYDFECDRFMASFTIYEIICGHEAFSSSTREIIEARRRHIFPKWTTGENVVRQKEVEAIWQR